jgi:hypothetical protein
MRKRMTYANVAMTLALVFAMTGGAYAAKKYLITSTKQISPSVLKSLVGKAGLAGAAGAQGAKGDTGAPGLKGDAGAPGAKGDAGSNGTNGADGKTVLNGNGAPSNSLGGNGDFYIDTSTSEIYGPKTGGTWGAPASLKGADGSPWTDGGTLPVGSTETGTYAMSLPASVSTTDSNGDTVEAPITGPMDTAISFNVPLAAGIPSEHVHFIIKGDPVPAECDDGVEPAASATHPEADSGNLCVFENLGFNVENQQAGVGGVNISGTVIQATAAGKPPFAIEIGSWAVTG